MPRRVVTKSRQSSTSSSRPSPPEHSAQAIALQSPSQGDEAGPPKSVCNWRFVIPRIPLTNNRLLRMHWAARRNDQKNWADHLMAFRRPSIPTFSKVSIAIIVYRRRLQDVDNAVASVKGLVDELVKSGWAVDDSPEWLDLALMEVKCKKGLERTLVMWAMGTMARDMIASEALASKES